MRKSLLLIILLLGCSVVANAQTSRLQAREAEWKSYVLPQTNFARQVTANKEFLFRVPADWKQEGSELSFTGPHSATISVHVKAIPDGYPFQQFFASVLQLVRDTPGAAEVTVARKTQLQDFEAREIFLELPDEEGQLVRRVSWLTASGPMVAVFSFQVPAEHAAATEPYFKAVVQSVIFISKGYSTFEALKDSIVKTATPGPIHEIESIVATLNDVSPNRDAAISRLASLFSTHPDVTLDLLLDRRPMVRVAVIRALAQTNNNALTPFLWEMLDDEELLVAETAARSVANTPDVVAKILKHSHNGFRTETIARVWPFLTRVKRSELLQKIFSQTALRPPVSTPSGKPDVKVLVTDLLPVKPGKPVSDIAAVSNDPNVQLGALTLLSNIPPDEFKLPLVRIMASNYDPLIIVGLHVANGRAEALPLDALFKLVASSNQEISKPAAYNLGFSASIPDIPRIETLLSKDSSGPKKDLDEVIKTSIKKILLRHELSNAKSATETRQIISKALTDYSLADFAWRYDCETTVAGCATSSNVLKPEFVIKPFGENLFPHKVKHYTAIPNPAQAVQRFYETLNGLQLETPRAQANLVMLMGYLRQGLLRSLSAPADASTAIEYTGVDANAPIALTAWTAEGALDSTNSAERKAIVIRVNDRVRFERAIEQFQESAGGFTDLTNNLSIATRAIAALPGLLPLLAEKAGSKSTEPEKRPVLKYAFTSDKDWNGIKIKTIEHRWLNADWTFESASTHIAFVGDTAILTPDLPTLRDLLTNVNHQERLANNNAYRKAVEQKGDIVYFSDVEAVMAKFSTTSDSADFKFNERGALNFGDATWENNHHLSFEESDWAKLLLPFDPKEVSAPRELLPASTIAYFLIKIDPVSLWTPKLRTSILKELPTLSNVWSMDFEKEVLPELGPECGAVVTELPDGDFNGGTWAAFCKLKSSKLAVALSAGKVFTGVGPTKDFAEVKVNKDSYFAAVRNGFLLISNRSQGLAAFDGKNNLAATRDYSRAVEKAPSGVVAFGGYNLEAAIASVSKKPTDEGDAEFAKVVTSFASAFHSQNFFATATSGSIEARSSVAMDRQGRYPVADFSLLTRGRNITFVTLQPSGVPITDQQRLSGLVVKIKARAPGPIDNIRDDIKTAEQSVEQKSPRELVVSVAARRGGAEKAVQLPIKDPQFTEFLKATAEFASEDRDVMERARQIAGDDRDAWSVARKLANWTYKNLEWRLVSKASAGETLATREADCTEFSQLFVAMARSLGLPSRMVSGLAYSDSSFGGHAWVEVWVGKWIELDPTWGTDFVDATHIRSNSDTLVSSAALNLIDLEVLETKRTVPEFQKSASALAQHLLTALPAGDQSEIEAALALPVLTDEYMGKGVWASMNESEREQMWSAYRRVLFELITGFGRPSAPYKFRLLHLEEKDDVANLTCLFSASDQLVKVRLVRRDDAWYLAEMLQTDVGLRVVHETLQPAITSIDKARTGQKPGPSSFTDYVRVILLLNKDASKALAAADAVLKGKPNDRNLRYLKALALLNLTKNEEAKKLLQKLATEGLPVAIYKLADLLSISEDENEKREAITLYERYSTLEPYDARVFRDLALAYDTADDLVKAEAAFRKVVELTPGDSIGYINLIAFLVMHDLLPEVRPVLISSDKNTGTDDDVFGNVFRHLYFETEPQAAKALAASEPVRLKTNAQANLYLGTIHFEDGKYPLALTFLNASAQLDKKSSTPYVMISQVHRKQRRWNAALNAGQHAISLDNNDSEAHYERACALARLGRIKDAMSSLEKAIELDSVQAEYAADEEDLKSLASLPAFKKLVGEVEKPQP